MAGSTRIARAPCASACSRAAALVLVAFLDQPPALAGPPQRPYPIPLRIEGFVGTKPEGIKALERWVVAVGDARFVFHVTKLVPIGVDIAYWDILNRLEPLPVTLTLYGDPELVSKFTAAPAGVPIAVRGTLEFGPGPITLLLSTVEPLPWPTPSAALETTSEGTPIPAALAPQPTGSGEPPL